jgi:hypothetical protein
MRVRAVPLLLHRQRAHGTRCVSLARRRGDELAERPAAGGPRRRRQLGVRRHGDEGMAVAWRLKRAACAQEEPPGHTRAAAFAFWRDARGAEVVRCAAANAFVPAVFVLDTRAASGDAAASGQPALHPPSGVVDGACRRVLSRGLAPSQRRAPRHKPAHEVALAAGVEGRVRREAECGCCGRSPNAVA